MNMSECEENVLRKLHKKLKREEDIEPKQDRTENAQHCERKGRKSIYGDHIPRPKFQHVKTRGKKGTKHETNEAGNA